MAPLTLSICKEAPIHTYGKILAVILEAALDETKDTSNSENTKDLSYHLIGIKAMFETSEPYMKSFLYDQTRTRDFKKYFDLVAYPLSKLIGYCKIKEPDVNLMNILALLALSLQTFLSSIDTDSEIRDHYDHLKNLVIEARDVLEAKKDKYQKDLRAKIDYDYILNLFDWIASKITYFDETEKIRMVVRRDRRNNVDRTQRFEILEDFIDTVYLPKRLSDTIGSVNLFLTRIMDEPFDVEITSDVEIRCRFKPDN